MALGASNWEDIKIQANNKLVTGNTIVDGGTHEIYYGALLQAGATGANAVRYADGANFAGIALEGTDENDTNIKIAKECEISGLSIAGSPVVGASVYATDDDIATLTETAGTYAVGVITAFDGTNYTVHFKV